MYQIPANLRDIKNVPGTSEILWPPVKQVKAIKNTLEPDKKLDLLSFGEIMEVQSIVFPIDRIYLDEEQK